MAAILQLRRGTSNVTLTEGELYLHQSSGSIQFGSGSSQHTLVKIGSNTGNVSLVGDLSINGNLTVSENITFGGSIITLGDANTDNIVISGELSSSLVPNDDAAFDLGSSLKRYKNLYVVSASIDNISLPGSNIVSGSSQIIYSQISSIPSGIVSGSSQVNANSITNFDSNVLDKINIEGVFSGSAQVTYSGISLIPSGIVSGSSQVTSLLPNGTVSGSSQVVYTSLSSIPSGIVSGSSQITPLLPNGVVSGSSQVVTLLPNGVVSGSSQVLGNTGIFSGSTQVNADSITNFDTNVKDKMNTDNVISGSGQVNITSTTGTLDISSRTNLAVSDTPTIDMILTGDTLSANAIGGIVSGSSQVSYIGLSNIPSGIVSGSSQITSILPSGVVSGSSQITYSGISSIPSGIVSGSSQVSADQTEGWIADVKVQLDANTVISGSSQVNADSITNFDTNVKDKMNTDSVVSGSAQVTSLLPSGVVSGSSQITYSGISSIPSGIVSGSTQVKSLLPSGTVSGSSQVNADTITNFDTNVKDKLNTDLVVSGSDSQVKTFLSLQNVTNESKATMFTSPTFTGTVTAPTPSSNDNSTKVATTAYVQQELSDLIGNASVAFDTLGEISSSLAADSGALDSLVTTVSGKLAKASNLSDLTDASIARTNLGVAIGINVQAYNSTLDSVSAGIYSGDNSITTIGTVTSGNINAILPNGTVSGSSQVTLSGDITGTANNTSIGSGVIVNDDVNASAAIAYTKLNLGGSNIVSGSSQINITTTTGTLDISSRTNLAVSDTENVDMILTGDTLSANLKGGVVSGSAQINISGSSDYVVSIKSRLNTENVHSGSYLGTATTSNLTEGVRLYYTNERVKTKLDSEGVISGSSQVNADSITNFDSNVLTYNNSLGVISGSSQVNADTITNFDTNVLDKMNVEGVISGSSQLTQSLDTRYLEIGGDGVISGSSQVSYVGLSNIPSGIVSGSTQVKSLLPSGTVSGSTQVNADTITNFDTNVKDKMNTDSVVSGSISSVKTLLSLDNVTNESKATMFTNPTFTGTVSGVTAAHVGLGTTESPTFEGLTLTSLDAIPIDSSELNAVFLSSSNELTYRALGTAALYHVTSSDGVALVSGSIAYESDNLLTAGAVKKYVDWRTDEILDAIGAADITAVNAGNGLGGGGTNGDVTLTLDTGSTHFNDGIKNKLNTDSVISSSLQILGGSGILSSSITNFTDYSSSIDGRLDSIEEMTGSYATTGSNTFYGEQTVQGHIIPNGFATYDLGSEEFPWREMWIGPFTLHIGSASLSEANLVTTESLQSQLPVGIVSSSTQIQEVTAATGILSSSTENFNNFSSSVDATQNLQNLRLSQIESVTASLDLTYEEKSSLTHTLVSGSSQINITTTTGILDISSRTNLAVSDTENVDMILTGDTLSANLKGGVVSGSSQINYSEISNISSGIVSGSSQIQLIKTDSGSFSTNMVSEGSNLYYTDTRVKTKLNTEGVISGSSQVLGNTGIVSSSAQIDSLGFLKVGGDGVISGSSQLTGSLVDLTSAQTISGTKTFTDIVVNGTGSFAYFTATQTSLQYIGDSFIVLNNDTPTQRYAGLAVYDSGSAGVTASLQFDGQLNDWFYEYSDDNGVTTDHGVVLFGPEYSTKGSPTYNTQNRILKSNGGHHLLDSNISDTGTLITLGSNSVVTGTFYATGTTLVSGSSQVLGNTGIVSSSAQIDALGFLQVNGDGVVSGSSQITLSGDITGTANNTAIGTGVIVNADVNASAAIAYTKLNLGGSSIVSGSTQITKTLQDVTSAGNTTTTTISITNTTASTSKTTGALIVSGGIGTSGDIFAGGDIVAYASSDRRLKDNILPIENSLQKINQIGGYSFDWNEEKQHIYKGKDYGVIAQEIEEILPELVDTRENGYKAVKYDKLVSLLIEGIKELSKEVEELKNKLNS